MTKSNSQEIEVRKPGAPSKYNKKTWEEAQELVENSPNMTMAEIAERVGIPRTTLESRASRSGWLNKRDISKFRDSEATLKKVNREIAFQINDLHEHSLGMIEALQYSHRIKIERDTNGKIHYRNFDDWPDRPINWDTLTDQEKEAHRRFISPVRLRAFNEQLHVILDKKTRTVEFISKMTKASLPKIDPDMLDVSGRDGYNTDPIIDGTNIFKGKKKDSDVEDLLGEDNE